MHLSSILQATSEREINTIYHFDNELDQILYYTHMHIRIMFRIIHNGYDLTPIST